MGSSPPQTVPVVSPTLDQSVIDQQSADYVRKRRGRAATILAGDQSQALSSLGTGSLSSAQLLGA